MGWIGQTMEDRIWSETARLIGHRQPTAVQERVDTDEQNHRPGEQLPFKVLKLEHEDKQTQPDAPDGTN